MQKLKISLKIRNPVLALGADTGNTVCFACGNNIQISETNGDLSYIENQEKLRKTIDSWPQPKVIACDLHPDFVSSLIAEELAQKYSAKLVKIQHHHAHIASVAAEHGLTDYVGIACDGLGYGSDGNLWGGEVFDVKGNRFKRIGSLEEHNQLGGDSATMQPQKMLYGILAQFSNKNTLLNHYSVQEHALYSKLLEQKYNIFTTTSTGRVLDAVSALLGVCDRRTYEGEPAIMLEKFATGPYNLAPVIDKRDRLILNTTELFKYLVQNLHRDKKRLAATAQMYIARGMYKIAEKPGKPIVFSGGVAYNKMISGHMKEKGVLFNRKLPPGDPNISFGQAVIANQ